MGILRNSTSSNERSPSCYSKEESRRDEFLGRTQEFDAKREEFRKYLERSGVIDALTKVLVALYEEPEKPDNALEYVYKYLGRITETSSNDTPNLAKELDSAKAQIAELEAKLLKCELQDTSA